MVSHHKARMLTGNREIIDESDVYIDVHKAIRRLTPAPKARVQRRLSEDPGAKYVDTANMKSNSESAILDGNKSNQAVGATSHESPMLSTSPKTATLMMRRSSAGLDGQFLKTTVPVRANFEDIKQHLKHLGPSNPATNPNKTRSTTVKIKPGSGAPSAQPRSASATQPGSDETPTEEGDETTSLLKPQISGKDGVQALRQTYGSVSPAITVQLAPQSNGIPELILDAEEQVDKSTQTPAQPDLIDLDPEETAAGSVLSQQQQQREPSPSQPKRQPRPSSSGESANSANSAEDKKTDTNTLVLQRPYVRSGSITENVIESRGVRKVVLETTSSNDEEESAVAAGSLPDQPRLLGRTPFGLFGRDRDNGKDKEGGDGKEDGRSQPSPVVEEEEDGEDVLSPGPEDDDEPGSYAEAAAKGTPQDGQAGPSSGAGKKKNRRKKRKGGKP